MERIFTFIGQGVVLVVALFVLVCIVVGLVDAYRNRRLRRLHEVAIQIRIRGEDGLVRTVVNIDYRGERTVIGESAIADRLSIHAKIPRR